MNMDDPRFGQEFSRRSMDRLMATAAYGKPKRRGEGMQITVPGANSGKPVSVFMALADTEAALAELDIDAPCGICHQNPCSWRLPSEDAAVTGLAARFSRWFLPKLAVVLVFACWGLLLATCGRPG